jgi:L-threonylcarbamoyladenylate synthase
MGICLGAANGGGTSSFNHPPPFFNPRTLFAQAPHGTIRQNAMKTEVVRVNSNKPEPEIIERAAAVIRGGGLVAFPTETVYGLGANAVSGSAVAKIFAAKGRPANNPLIVHVSRVEQARELVARWPDRAEQLAEAFWPGPLTLVMLKQAIVPDIVTAGGPTVALRMPAHPVALRLIEAAGCPIAAPSANVSNAVSPTSAEHVERTLGGRIDMILDGGPCRGGIESTVLDLTGAPPRILRPGLVTREQVEPIVGRVEQQQLSIDSRRDVLPSPGTSPRHYAPRAILECYVNDGEGRSRVEQLAEQGKKGAWLHRGDSLTGWQSNAPNARMPDDPNTYARELYRRLHELDEQMVDYIIVSLPPDEPTWFAVRDRLRRAAAVWKE